jgi:glycerol uptake operon antiterminator
MINSFIIPALSTHQMLRSFIKTDHEIGILMNFQLAQLEGLISELRDANKKVFVHLELIKGLSNDEFGAIYLIQEFKVDGIITTKPKVIELCKKRNVYGIMRFFLKDTLSLEQSFEMMTYTHPDAVEILPAIPKMVDLVKSHISIPVILGGLIKSESEVEDAFKAGAMAVTTSSKALWDIKKPSQT